MSLCSTRTRFSVKEKAQTTAISHTGFSTTPNSLWMKSALMRTLQQELGFCSLISLIEVLIRCENLNKYVFVSFPTSSIRNGCAGTNMVTKVHIFSLFT